MHLRPVELRAAFVCGDPIGKIRQMRWRSFPSFHGSLHERKKPALCFGLRVLDEHPGIAGSLLSVNTVPEPTTGTNELHEACGVHPIYDGYLLEYFGQLGLLHFAERHRVVGDVFAKRLVDLNHCVQVRGI